MDLVAWLYEKSASFPILLEECILEKIIKAYHGPLCSKHNSTSPQTWSLAASCFIRVLKVGLPLARKNPSYFTTMWPHLADTLDKFLFSTRYKMLPVMFFIRSNVPEFYQIC